MFCGSQTTSYASACLRASTIVPFHLRFVDPLGFVQFDFVDPLGFVQFDPLGFVQSDPSVMCSSTPSVSGVTVRLPSHQVTCSGSRCWSWMTYPSPPALRIRRPTGTVT